MLHRTCCGSMESHAVTITGVLWVDIPISWGPTMLLIMLCYLKITYYSMNNVQDIHIIVTS